MKAVIHTTYAGNDVLTDLGFDEVEVFVAELLDSEPDVFFPAASLSREALTNELSSQGITVVPFDTAYVYTNGAWRRVEA